MIDLPPVVSSVFNFNVYYLRLLQVFEEESDLYRAVFGLDLPIERWKISAEDLRRTISTSTKMLNVAIR